MYRHHTKPVHHVSSARYAGANGSSRTFRNESPLEVIIDDMKARVPSALADGLVPVGSMDPYLIVHAPLVELPGYITEPGDVFEAELNGVQLPETRVDFSGDGEGYVELRINKSRLDALEDGTHSISYRVYIDLWGEQVRSGRTRIVLDRKPAGGRYLPRIVFDERLELDGLSRSTLLTLPDSKLVGTIPDYAGIDPRDTVHVFYKLRGSDRELSAGAVPASTDGRPMIVTFDLPMLEQIEATGRVDFYYLIEDPAGVRSTTSSPTALNMSIKGSPATLPAPVIVGSDDGLVTDADVRPTIAIRIPQIQPAATPGDTIQLYFGAKAFPVVEVDADDGADGAMKTLYLDYATMRSFAEVADAVPFEESLRYIHRRGGVASRSDEAIYTFDLTLPGGWDPTPETVENEALSLPILRGATGKDDNVINLHDSSLPATAFIAPPSGGSRAAGEFQRGDSISLLLGGELVGSPVVYDGQPYPLEIEVPAAALNANAGFVHLAYEIERELSTTPHIVVAVSPPQRVRIDSTSGLPGGGNPLAGGIFTKAREREASVGIYGLFVNDFVDGFTPLRVFGYANMSAGDTLRVSYEGFDKYDGGDPVDGAKGELSYRVSESDLVPKSVADPETGDFVYVDIDFPIDIAKQVAHGHIEYRHEVINDIGAASSPSENVLIRVRF